MWLFFRVPPFFYYFDVAIKFKVRYPKTDNNVMILYTCMREISPCWLFNASQHIYR